MFGPPYQTRKVLINDIIMYQSITQNLIMDNTEQHDQGQQQKKAQHNSTVLSASQFENRVGRLNQNFNTQITMKESESRIIPDNGSGFGSLYDSHENMMPRVSEGLSMPPLRNKKQQLAPIKMGSKVNPMIIGAPREADRIPSAPEIPSSQINLGNKVAQVQALAVQETIPARILRCPDCNSLLQVEYSCNGFTLSWSLFLLMGLTCWVPWVVDACKRSQSRCLTCDKVVQVYDPSCC